MANIDLNVALGTQSDKNTKYKDIDFAFKFDEGKIDLASNTDLKAVQGSIHNLFTWVPGQRVLQPEFPGNLLRYVYEGINNITEQNIVNEIYDVFDRWEPRVDIQYVDVVPYPGKNMYVIYIEYAIPTLSSDSFSFETALNTGD